MQIIVDASKLRLKRLFLFLFNSSYTLRTKISLAMTIIASLCLGIMIFFSHLISFAKIDYILDWLIPVCFVFLTLAIVCITVAVSVMGALMTEDTLELRYQWSLYASTLNGRIYNIKFV
jgi:hypothetical protein